MNDFLRRSYSQVFKNMRLMMQSPFRLFDASIWPLTSLFAFLFLVNSFSSDPSFLLLIIMGMMGWQAVQQFQMGISSNYMDEYWSHSLTHLFITPIRLTEFVFGGVLSGFVKFALVTVLFFVATNLVYSYAIPNLALFAVAVFFLVLFGISVGMLNLGFMFLYGENAISLAWTLSDILVVLSGVYYSISILPGPLHLFAQILPSTYAFDLIKSMIGIATPDWNALIALSAIWLLGTFLFLRFAYHRAKKTGRLVRVA